MMPTHDDKPQCHKWRKSYGNSLLSFRLKHSPKLGRNKLANHTYFRFHYDDVIMGTIASKITSLAIVYSIVYSSADQRKHQSSASLAFVRGIHRGPVNSPHKWPVTRKMFPFDDVIMSNLGVFQARNPPTVAFGGESAVHDDQIDGHRDKIDN